MKKKPKDKSASGPIPYHLGTGYLSGNFDVNLYCGLPVWEHNPHKICLPDALKGKRIRLIAEIL